MTQLISEWLCWIMPGHIWRYYWGHTRICRNCTRHEEFRDGLWVRW